MLGEMETGITFCRQKELSDLITENSFEGEGEEELFEDVSNGMIFGCTMDIPFWLRWNESNEVSQRRSIREKNLKDLC